MSEQRNLVGPALVAGPWCNERARRDGPATSAGPTWEIPLRPMLPRFREKTFRHRATRHAGEAYSPVLAPDGETLAFLQVSAEAEILMLSCRADPAPIAVSSAGYLFSPCFAGDWLTWVQRSASNDEWEILGVRWKDASSAATKPCVLFTTPGARPIHLASASDAYATWLAWEERRGCRTTIRLARLDADGIRGEPRLLSHPDENAYDPALALAADGTVYCAYTAYSDDNYRIFLAHLDASGEPLGAARRISDRAEACVWPSLWPAARGGVWFSFTCFSVPNTSRPEQTQALSYVKHERYLRQRQFFGHHGLAHIGWCDGGELRAPLAGASPSDLQFFSAAGLVLGSEGAGHTQVFEDAGGGLHVLLRQHARPDRSLTPETASPPLKAHPRFTPRQPRQMHPNLAIVSLAENSWSPPHTLVPRAHFDLPIGVTCAGRDVAIAFGEDARLTGWSGGGEWFDDVGEVGLGIAGLECAAPPAQPTLLPLAIAPFPAGRLTTPHELPASTETWHDRTFALGQTHCHSNLSVCRRELDRDPHLNYRFMQDVQHCRFGLLTDHEYNLWHSEMLLVRKLADYYYFPGEFVALHGYEWTGSDARDCAHDGGPFGHVNVLCFDRLAAADFHNPSDPASRGRSLDALWNACAGRRIVTPPHHVVDRSHPYNWNFWSDDFEPVIEIFQDDRGSGEQPGAPGLTNSTRAPGATWAIDALRRGRRFGFIAGGDHGGIALAGVWTRALTREALHEAFRERACYATTGIHVSVTFTHHSSSAEFELRVGSTQPVARVEVLRNGNLAQVFENTGNAGPGHWRWSASDASTGDFWYCRIHWMDGELAWTSPLWL